MCQANEQVRHRCRTRQQDPAPTEGMPVTPDHIIRAVGRRWRLIGILSVAAAVLGVLSATVTAPVYRSTVTSVLTVSSPDGHSDITSTASIIGTVAPTLAEISTSSSMLVSVAEETGIPAEEVAAHITVSNPTDTLLVVVRATSSSPEQAQDLAEAATAALAERTSSVGFAMDSANGFLSLSEVDPSPAAQLVSPSKSRSGAIGLIAGAWSGLLVALRLEEVRRTTNETAAEQAGHE